MAEQQGGRPRVRSQIGMYRDRTTTSQELQKWSVIRKWRAKLIQRVLRILVIAGALTTLAGSYYRWSQGRYLSVAIFVFAYGYLLFITYSKRLKYAGQVWGLIILLVVLAGLDFFIDGRAGGARLFLMALIFTTAIFLGERGAIYALIFSGGLNAFFAYLYIDGVLVGHPLDAADGGGWVSSIFVLLILGVFIVTSINYLIPRLLEAMTQSEYLARELTDYQGRLEDLVAQQEIDLSRRSTQLQTAAQVARESANQSSGASSELDQVLDRTVRLISERFGFYHAAIYLLETTGADAGGEIMVLHAVSSEGGQVLLARGHAIKLGGVGIVAYAATRGELRMASDVDAAFVSANQSSGEVLPNTRSEIALPLLAREGVIGVLDVQSTESGAFNADDVLILQTLADQIALVSSNAQLVLQVESQLEVERQTYQELSRKAWSEVVSSLAAPGYRRNQHGIVPVADELYPRMVRALNTAAAAVDEASTGVAGGQGGGGPAVALPIFVRGQVIGVIDARKPSDEGPWTPDELALLETMTTQLDTVLDNAQLYQNSQLLANRERFTREIADRMRRAVDMEDLIRTTVEEMASVLSAPVTFVQLVESPETEGVKS